jgi:hypothetical protein
MAYRVRKYRSFEGCHSGKSCYLQEGHCVFPTVGFIASLGLFIAIFVLIRALPSAGNALRQPGGRIRRCLIDSYGESGNGTDIDVGMSGRMHNIVRPLSGGRSGLANCDASRRIPMHDRGNAAGSRRNAGCRDADALRVLSTASACPSGSRGPQPAPPARQHHDRATCERLDDARGAGVPRGVSVVRRGPPAAADRRRTVKCYAATSSAP